MMLLMFLEMLLRFRSSPVFFFPNADSRDSSVRKLSALTGLTANMGENFWMPFQIRDPTEVHLISLVIRSI